MMIEKLLEVIGVIIGVAIGLFMVGICEILEKEFWEDRRFMKEHRERFPLDEKELKK